MFRVTNQFSLMIEPVISYLLGNSSCSTETQHLTFDSDRGDSLTHRLTHQRIHDEAEALWKFRFYNWDFLFQQAITQSILRLKINVRTVLISTRRGHFKNVQDFSSRQFTSREMVKIKVLTVLVDTLYYAKLEMLLYFECTLLLNQIT